ncbi:MAG: RluA family pseudouridine synthase [Eubacteriales bacterium]|nr:RluA family pseudouridine synthase [Eubacteriales bacterium]
MRQFIVRADEQGQRLDKYLKRRLPLAPPSFIYKMLRKKNITLCGKKADGGEKVSEGDIISLYLSEETIANFSAPGNTREAEKEEREAVLAYQKLSPQLGPRPVIYEDENILIVRKTPGILSQKAEPGDLSMNEWLRGYLRITRKPQEAGTMPEHRNAGAGAPHADATDPGESTPPEHRNAGAGKPRSGSEDLRDGSGSEPAAFTPSVCNRLDRNTGGLLLCAKSLQGSRALSAVLRGRRIRKTYRMLVHGQLRQPGEIRADLIKDRLKNQVWAAGESGEESRDAAAEGSADRRRIRRSAVTRYRPVRTGKNVTLVEADLITGRSHQLRVHMASIGHPILFDPRYGDRMLDCAAAAGKKLPRERGGQLLWCARMTFPGPDCEEMRGVLAPLSGRTFACPEPGWWEQLLH